VSRPPGEPSFDPQAYRRWFETPLGSRFDRDEKEVVFALAGLQPGERVLDLGCGDGNDTLPAAARAGLAVGLDRSLAMLAAAPLGSPNWRSRRLRAALLCQPQYRTEKTGTAALIGRS
jgi:trans-aconitate methyltransferase